MYQQAEMTYLATLLHCITTEPLPLSHALTFTSLDQVAGGSVAEYIRLAVTLLFAVLDAGMYCSSLHFLSGRDTLGFPKPQLNTGAKNWSTMAVSHSSSQ